MSEQVPTFLTKSDGTMVDVGFTTWEPGSEGGWALVDGLTFEDAPSGAEVAFIFELPSGCFRTDFFIVGNPTMGVVPAGSQLRRGPLSGLTKCEIPRKSGLVKTEQPSQV